MDYKELIETYRHYASRWESGEQLLLSGAMRIQDTLREAADSIETLLVERDAAVKDLTMIGHCKTCWNITPWCADNPDSCEGYVWRGPQKGK